MSDRGAKREWFSNCPVEAMRVIPAVPALADALQNSIVTYLKTKKIVLEYDKYEKQLLFI